MKIITLFAWTVVNIISNIPYITVIFKFIIISFQITAKQTYRNNIENKNIVYYQINGQNECESVLVLKEVHRSALDN